MKVKATLNLIVLALLSCANANAATADTKPDQEEAIVVGACMVQKFTEHTPPISQPKIEKCADATSTEVAKCLGLSEEEYNNTVTECVKHLTVSKCVAKNLKTPLMNYETCQYERDTAGCYKKLGFTTEKVNQLMMECEKAGN